VKEPTRRSISRRSRHLLSLHIDGTAEAHCAEYVAIPTQLRPVAWHQKGALENPLPGTRKAPWRTRA
jgi:hypothetical protein